MMDRRSGTSYRRYAPPLATALTLSVVIALLAGPIVAPLALLVVGSAVVGGPAVGLFTAHLVIVAVTTSLTGLEIVGFEAALAPLLAMPHRESIDRTSAIASWLGAVGLGGVVVITAQLSDEWWVLAVAVLAAGALAMYLLHRVELVVLDLVPDDDSEDTQSQ